MWLDEKIVVVEDCKPIHNVGTEVNIYVFRDVLALT